MMKQSQLLLRKRAQGNGDPTNNNRELGTAKTENFTQGSFVIEELTDLVEKAVIAEFQRLTERGGVLGAMERMYQRNKIQEESLNYESLKHSGELPIVGVNTF